MRRARALAAIAGFALGASLCLGHGALAQEETATAEDGAPASEAPAETNPAPNVPLGANLTPPLGALPPGPALISGPGSGQPGSSTVSMAPGTQTTGVAREGRNASHERPPAETAPAAAPDAAPADSAPADASAAAPDAAPAAGCGDYPTWYDAQLALESSVDPALNAALDPDGDAIACEAVMYP